MTLENGGNSVQSNITIEYPTVQKPFLMDGGKFDLSWFHSAFTKNPRTGNGPKCFPCISTRSIFKVYLGPPFPCLWKVRFLLIE